MRMKRTFVRLGWSMALSTLLLATGCGNGGNGGASVFALFVGGPQTMDGGQTTVVTASIVNDTTPGGATFTVTGGGSLSAPTTTYMGTTEKVSVNYTAPATATTATVTATSVHTPAQSYSVVITVNAALTITTSSLPTGTVGTVYNVTPAETGGTGTVTWSLANGTLPSGLSLSSTNGAITGTPTTAGSYTFTLAVTDTAPTAATAVQTYNVTINPPLPVVTALTLPTGIIGTTYSQQLAYTGGGTGTATWTITSGSLPANSGLTLSSSGLIAGTPTTALTYSFSVAVTVGTQTSAPVALTLTVLAPLVITTTTLPSAHVNVAYTQQLTYTGGGAGTPVWAIVSGSLPASSGFTLSSSGLISGTPTAAGSYTFGVTVTVGQQTSAVQNYTLAALSTQITSGTTATGEVGIPFAFQVTALGGSAPYTYSVAAGSALPPGLTIGASTGLISGTPTSNSGSPYSAVVQAADTKGATATQTMTITINASRGSALNGELNGQYAFLLSGFDASGNPLSVAGEFKANGSGTITGGQLDENGTALAAPLSNVTVNSATYEVGSDGRGLVTLTTASGSTSYVIAINSVTSGIAASGTLVEFDATGQRLSGQFALQTPAAFSTTAVAGGYAFGLSGFAANSTAVSPSRSANVGELQLAAGIVSSSEYVASSSITPVVPVSGTLSIATTGRGTLTLVRPSSAGNLDYVVYVVSASKLFLLSSDPASGTASGVRDLQAGLAQAQTIANGSFVLGSLNGNSVFRLQGLQSLTPIAQVGFYTFDGTGNIANGAGDQNLGGVASQNTFGGTYTVAINGRINAFVKSASFGGCIDCAKTAQVFYLTGSNAGFALDFGIMANTGTLEAQNLGTFTNSSITGSYSFGNGAPLVPSSAVVNGELAATGSGSLTGTLDEAVTGTLLPDIAFSATYSTATTGRVPLTVSGSTAQVLYFVTPTRALGIDLTSKTPAVVEAVHQ